VGSVRDILKVPKAVEVESVVSSVLRGHLNSIPFDGKICLSLTSCATIFDDDYYWKGILGFC
jgi:hypothetical protein